MNKHTPGKWYSCPAQGGEAIRIECNGDGNDCKPIATLIGPDRTANGRRIVACVNGCRGIENPEAILDVFLQAENAIVMMQMAWKQYGVGGMFECMDALRSAIGKAQKGGVP